MLSLEVVLIETSEIRPDVQTSVARQDDQKSPHRPIWQRWSGQFVRFGFVGVLNTLLDVFLLNGLLWLFPTTNTFSILLFNSLAYGIGAVNSFFLNKYWTFGSRQKTTHGEVRRFTLTTLLGIGCNDILVWLASNLFLSFISNTSLATNAAKILAISGTVFVSYLGMRLWVFVKKTPHSISPELQENERTPLTTPVQRGYRCPLCQERSCFSQATCPYTEMVSIPTQQLRLNRKIKKILLVNNYAQERV
jgi:putative flippase GtrA